MFVYGCVSFFQGPFNLKIDNIFKNQAHVYYEKNIMYISAPALGNQLGGFRSCLATVLLIN